MPRAKKALSAILDVVEEQAINEVPQELKDQLNALEPVEEDTSLIEETWELAAAEIARIDERADYAIQVVTQSIKTQAAVSKGQVILEIREKYGHRSDFEGSFTAFAERIGTSSQNISRWVAAARAVEEHSAVFGDAYMLSLSSKTLGIMNGLPSSVQTAMLSDAVEEERTISIAEVREVGQSTPVKILATQEKIEEKQEFIDSANELMNEAKEINGPGAFNDPEYKRLYDQAAQAKEAIETLNEKITTLKADLVGEKAKAESAMKAQESLNKELQGLKWDDELTRDQRVKRIQSTLTVAIPNVLADLMRFVTEEAHYSETYKTSIREQMLSLKTFLEEHS